MRVEDAQREVRLTFVGGAVGQLVSALVWAASAAFATWGTPRQAITVLVVGGFSIFPLTQLGLRLAGRRSALSRDNPLNGLGMQVAFTLPLGLPVVAAVAVHHLEWFYPAFMVVLGAHYLPFVFLYGMRMFAGLCAVLVGGGTFLALHGPDSFAFPAWVTTLVLLTFSALGLARVSRELADVPRSAA